MYLQCFLAYFVQKRQNACIAPYIGKRRNVTRNVYFKFFFFLCRKMLKRMNSTQWRHRTTLPEAIFFFFLPCLVSKRQNAYKASYMRKRKGITRNVLWVFLSFLGTKKQKSVNSSLYRETKRTCFWVFFHLVMDRNAKMHAKEPIWGNEKGYYEKCVLRVFLSFLDTKTLKRLYRTLYG